MALVFLLSEILELAVDCAWKSRRLHISIGSLVHAQVHWLPPEATFAVLQAPDVKNLSSCRQVEA